MAKKHTVLMLISIFALWINSFFNEQIQYYSGLLLIFLVGILHGSNDIILIKKTLNKESLLNMKLIIYYVLVVVFGFVLFFFFPSITLILFIMASSYHFGEQHWHNLKLKKLRPIISVFQMTYGFFIFTILFIFHKIEVNQIISSITLKKIENINYNYIMFFTSIILLILGYILYLNVKNFKKHLGINIVYLILFSLLFYTADLIWGFAIYFVVWHSFPSIIDQILFIYGKVNFENLKKYIINALPYWFISILGLFLYYLYLKENNRFESVLFSFLAAITFPHVFIMIQLFKKKDSNK